MGARSFSRHSFSWGMISPSAAMTEEMIAGPRPTTSAGQGGCCGRRRMGAGACGEGQAEKEDRPPA